MSLFVKNNREGNAEQVGSLIMDRTKQKTA